MLRGPRWRLWQSGILGNGVLSARHVARGSRDLASARRPAARRWASSKSLHGDQFCWPSRDRHRGKLCRLALRASNLTSCSQTGQSTAADDAPTIYALSSGPGRAGVAVIRISGSRALDVYKALCPNKAMPKPRYAAVRTLLDPAKSSHRLQQDQQDQPAILDPSALVLFFPGPRSVTGEDVLELHVHGGRATVRAVLRAIPQAVAAAEAASDGDDVGTLIRYAEPGEFTRRAFLNGRLADLAQVDALGDVLAAETEQQRAAAVRSHSGSRSLAGTYEDWRSRLLLARGEIEALIDFSEDQHFDESPTELLASVATLVRGLLADIDVHVDAGHRAELLRSGVRVAIVGPPNAGKSSLMNRIVGREASIVSGEAGTTRDVVEVALDIRGFLCTFADTAGLRSSVHPVQSAGLALEGGDQKRSAVRDVGGVDSSGDLDAGGDNVDGSHAVVGSVEQEGIRRAKARASESDMVIALASIEGNDDADNGLCVHYDLESLRLAAAAPSCMVVINKRDRVPTKARLDELVGKFVSEVLATVPGLEGVEVATISCRDAGCHGLRQASGASSRPSETGADRGGIRALIDALAGSLARMTSLPADLADLLGVNERMSQLLQNCRRHLEAFMEEAGKGTAEVDDLDHHPGATRQARHRDPDVVVAAEHLREAAQDLARITGRGEGGDVEEVLGVVFEKFCVGK